MTEVMNSKNGKNNKKLWINNYLHGKNNWKKKKTQMNKNIWPVKLTWQKINNPISIFGSQREMAVKKPKMNQKMIKNSSKKNLIKMKSMRN